MLRPACEILERMADWGHFVSVVPSLADALYEQGRGHEAERWIDLAARWTLEDDLDAQIGWRRVRARLLARRGDFDAAERLAHDAINLALKTDYLENRASAFTDLAEVLRLAGRTSEAAASLQEAIGLYDQKGNAVAAQKLRRLLAATSIND
jgi:tetratricopeptide (TPR) repeat protein